MEPKKLEAINAVADNPFRTGFFLATLKNKPSHTFMLLLEGLEEEGLIEREYKSELYQMTDAGVIALVEAA